MKFFIFLFVYMSLTSIVNAATIQYIDTGKAANPVKIILSRDLGVSWKEFYIKKGQTLNTPKDTTNILINNVPGIPQKNYKIKEGVAY